MTLEEALERGGMTLPIPRPAPASWTWARTVRSGALLFVASHGPFVDGKIVHAGRVGLDISVETGTQAAELTTLNILGTLKAELGELARISRFVPLVVFVNGAPTSPNITSSRTGLRTCSRTRLVHDGVWPRVLRDVLLRAWATAD